MKNFRMLSVMTIAVSGWITSFGQVTDATVPGDNFSLEGALELFKKSESPEDFERLLNSPDSKVNNLDLNGDGYTDYVRVFDKQEGNVHVFIIQDVVSETENQDVAVIELEKQSDGHAVLQIIGDEDIYGIETIIEPTREVRTYAGTTTTNAVVNVSSWPVVHYVYNPYYAGWSSPWGWYHPPVWWSSWRPVVYVHYHDYWGPYRSYYSSCNNHRIVYANSIYRPHRARSIMVYNRHYEQVNRYRSERDNNGNRNDHNGDAHRTRGATRGSDHQQWSQNSSRENSGSRGNDTQTGSRSNSGRSNDFQREHSDFKNDNNFRTEAHKNDRQGDNANNNYDFRGENQKHEMHQPDKKSNTTMPHTRDNSNLIQRSRSNEQQGSGQIERTPSGNDNAVHRNKEAQNSNQRNFNLQQKIERPNRSQHGKRGS
jgi:hypothetical protein